MAISGLVITLCAEPERAGGALDRLRADPRFALGDRSECRVPATLETSSPREDRQAWSWLLELDGVVTADLVFVHLDAPQEISR